MSGQMIPHPYAYDAHGPGRRSFSVLCWRGWCDNGYRNQEIGVMAAGFDLAAPAATGLPARQCPAPGTCECECHDQPAAVNPEPSARV